MKKYCLIAACLSVFLLFCGCDGGAGGEYSVFQYRVTGSASSVDITYNSNGGISQINGVVLPYTINLAAVPSGGLLHVSARNNGGSGDVTVQILDCGIVIAHNTSSGPYCIAETDYYGDLLDFRLSPGKIPSSHSRDSAERYAAESRNTIRGKT